MPEEIMATPQATEQTQEAPAPTTAQEERKLRVKYMHEEREIPETEAVALAQKGMDYDRVKTQYSEAARYKQFAEDQARKYGMTVEDWQSEMAAAADAAMKAPLIEQGVPEEFAKEIIDAREIKKAKETEEERAKAEARKRKEVEEFVSMFPGIKTDDIPKQVFIDADNGIPLSYAYARHAFDGMKNQLAEMQKRIETAEHNARNAAASTGPATGATADPGFIDQDTFEANRKNSEWVRRNLDKIQASRKHWK